MRTFTAISSDLTPSQTDAIRAEYHISPDGFVDRAKRVANLSAEDWATVTDALKAEAAEREARGEPV